MKAALVLFIFIKAYCGCPEGYYKEKYKGKRRPKAIRWKVPVQLISGAAFGGIIATTFTPLIVKDNTANSTNDEGGGPGILNYLNFQYFVSYFLVTSSIYSISAPLPIYAIGNYGNEKSSFAATMTGGVIGFLIPGFGPPIISTILNRKLRTYRYSCKKIKNGAAVKLFKPEIRYKLIANEWVYKINIIQIHI